MSKRGEISFVDRKAEWHHWLFINPLSSYTESCLEKYISQVWRSVCLYSPKYLCQVYYGINTLRNRKRFLNGSYLRKSLICLKVPRQTTAKQTILAKSNVCIAGHGILVQFSQLWCAHLWHAVRERSSHKRLSQERNSFMYAIVCYQ